MNVFTWNLSGSSSQYLWSKLCVLYPQSFGKWHHTIDFKMLQMENIVSNYLRNKNEKQCIIA